MLHSVVKPITEGYLFPLSLICLAVCKAGDSGVCLLVTKLVLFVLYYKFEQFTNILIHNLLNSYITVKFRVQFQLKSIKKCVNNTLHTLAVCNYFIK